MRECSKSVSLVFCFLLGVLLLSACGSGSTNSWMGDAGSSPFLPSLTGVDEEALPPASNDNLFFFDREEFGITDESQPLGPCAVAASQDNNAQIYGQVRSANGEPLGESEIISGDWQNAHSPDVAYSIWENNMLRTKSLCLTVEKNGGVSYNLLSIIVIGGGFHGAAFTKNSREPHEQTSGIAFG